MRLEYDSAVHAMYIYLREGVAFGYTKKLDDSTVIDFGQDHRPIGIELLDVPEIPELSKL